MARSYGDVLFTLVQCFVQTHNIITGAFGTAIELLEPQTFEFGFEADNDTIKAAGYNQHLLTVTTGATFKLSAAGITFDALAAICGATNESSGTTPNQLRRLRFGAGGAGLGYFALVGRMAGEQGDDAWVGLPYCKLDSPPNWKAEQNKFIMSEVSGKAIKSGSYNLVEIFAHETAAAITAGNISNVWG